MMKYTHSLKYNAGFGLIEVLVTTVVIALGLLAVASLQGDLVSSSRNNKTRAECQALASTKIENLRDTVERTGALGYDSLASSVADETITGVTEAFTRNWVVTPQTDPDRKQLSVTVTWGGGGADKQCVIQSVLAYDSLGNSTLAAAGASAGSSLGGPSTNAESSDEIAEHIDLPSSQTPGSIYTAPGGEIYIVEDNGTKGTETGICSTYSPALTIFENGLYTRRVDEDTVSGKEAIELYDVTTINSINYCTPRVRFNGGVIIPLRGIVYSKATDGNGQNAPLLDYNLFTFNTSESGTYCVFNPAANAISVPYVCYVGGNCTFGPAGTHASDGSNIVTGDDTIVTECPAPTLAAERVGPGGWRGKVGLLGVATNGVNVCFAEEFAGSPATLDTARNYFTRNAGLNEGINKPYSCHDFLIINGKSTEAQIHNECVLQANTIGGFTLASKTIQRDISGNNVFDPIIETNYCSAASGTDYTIVGTIVNANSPPIITVDDSTSFESCTTTNTTYTCMITSSASSVTISGLYNSESITCSASPSPTGCTLSFSASANPTYTINGTISGTSAAIDTLTLELSDGGTCTINNAGTYSCLITTTSASTITLTASAAIGGSVSPNTAQSITLPASAGTVTGPGFSASLSPTYTISGSISLGNNVEVNTVAVEVNTGTGSCELTGTPAENTTVTYSCTVTAGDNDLHFTLSQACSTGGGSKKYEITNGTDTTLGTGSLIIDLGNVGGNANENITISKSNSNC